VTRSRSPKRSISEGNAIPRLRWLPPRRLSEGGSPVWHRCDRGSGGNQLPIAAGVRWPRASR
jgi:hypothetical protein